MPAYVRTAIDVVPGLTKTDSMVLKVLGDKAMSDRHMQVIHIDDVIDELRTLDVPEEEAADADALEVLSKRRYVEPLETFGDAPYAANYNMTTRGFDQYARIYVQRYEAIVRDVISRIVNAGDRDSHAIRKALSQPNLLIEHILTTLDQDHRRMIDTVQTIGRDSPIQIINVSAELKRLLRE
jgi:hypothetical protein